MKILYDHQAFSYQDYGGVSRYFVELYQKLNIEHEVDFSIKFSNSEFLSDINQKAVPFFPTKNFVGKRFTMNLLNKPFSIRKIKQNKFDIFHPTYFDPYFINPLSKPAVITVHDLTFDLFPQFFKTYDFAKRLNKVKCFENVDAIIAVSNNTKKDIIELYNIAPEKIHVVYHGVNFTLNDSNLQNYKLHDDLVPQSYILYVGSRRGYKNFLFFVKSIGSLLLETNVKLVCIGGGGFNKEEYNEFVNLGIESKLINISFSERNLKWLYQNALFFVFPSLYEGFGMPILEAFSNNCPVVLSNRSCFPEIADDAAVYFEPDNRDSIFSTIKKIIEDDSVRDSIAEIGKNRLKNFSWVKTVAETYKVYEKVTS